MQPLIFFSLLFTLFAFRLTGQNLLPNFGFEEYIECPGDSASIIQIADWYPSLVVRDFKSDDWRTREYLHSCDPAVEPFWAETLGRGILKRSYSFDPIEEEVWTTINWTTIQAPLQRDVIYYLEFSAVPNSVYYPPEDQWYRTRCPQASLGFKFDNEDFQDTIGLFTYIEPDLDLSNSGTIYEAGDVLRIGNCYQAHGDEKYLLFGHFRHDFNPSDNRCVGEDLNTWLTRSTLMDNFKLQQLEVEICCDQTVCNNDLNDFSEFVSDYALLGVRYFWNDGVEGLVRSFDQSGTYQLEISTLCGSVFSNAIDVTVEECSSQVFVPNAFSPNDDGLNDHYQPLFSEKLELGNFTFSIFNRWGQLVFYTQNKNTAWDGTSKGRAQEAGVYLWRLEYEYPLGDEIERVFQSGELTLLR